MKPLNFAAILAITTGFLLSSLLAPVRASSLQETPVPNDPLLSFTVHLPIVHRTRPSNTNIGSETNLAYDPVVLLRAKAASINWMRATAFDWKTIEPVQTFPASYDWSQVNETNIKNLGSNGLRTIAVVKNTPVWAQKKPGVSCGPIAEPALDDFARFMQELVKRYGSPPYNIKYWELGNEPDVDSKFTGPEGLYGCWGDETDAYYGGGYYAKMLQAVYPAVKMVDPGAQIMIGGLLLNCDPTNPPSSQETCKSSLFLEGILRNGGSNDGGKYFDAVAFHAYPPFVASSLYADENYPSWDKRGGVVLGKIHFLREMMAKYGVDKPLIQTEGALTCPEWNTTDCLPPGTDFFESQADYVVWLYVRNWAAGVKATIWYRLDGESWRYSSLLNNAQEPKLSYLALQFLTRELGSATYSQQLLQYPSLRLYEFTYPWKRVWVMWAPDEQPYTIDLPPAMQKVFDVYGNDITPAGSQLTVSRPVYVELSR